MYFIFTIIQIQPRARFPSNGRITTTFLCQTIDDSRRRFGQSFAAWPVSKELPDIQTLRVRLPLMVEGKSAKIFTSCLSFLFLLLTCIRIDSQWSLEEPKYPWCVAFAFHDELFLLRNVRSKCESYTESYTPFDFRNDRGYKRKQTQS